MGERISKLDGIRGIAALLIVILHYPKEFLPSYLFFLKDLNLYICVDLFFCLSGFVIAYNYPKIDNRKVFFNFLFKRFFRLFPLLLFSSIIILFFSEIFDLKQNISWFISAISFTNSTPILFWLIHVFNFDSINYNNGIYNPSWSISSEMITYFIYAIVSLIIPTKRKWIFLFLIVIAYIFSILNGGYWGYTIGLGIVRGLVSFFIGFLVFYNSIVFKSLSFKISENLLLITFIFVMIYFNFFLEENIDLFGMFLIPIYFGLFIFFLLKSRGIITKFLEFELVNFIGKISFSIYLNHYIVLAIFKKIEIFNFTGKDLSFYITISVIIIYSYFTYIILENKLFKLLKSKFLIK